MRVQIPFVVQDDLGNAVDGTAHVYLRGTSTHADTFAAASGGSPLSQPLTVTNGRILGWVEEGSYDIVAAAGSTSWTRSWDAVGYSIPPIGLQVPTSVNYVTASLATNAQESGVVAMYKGWQVRRVVTDRAARVRLYTTPTKRDADAARPITVDPPDYPTSGAAPDHGCLLEVATDASHLDIPLSRDGWSNTNNVPITVDNAGATGVVTATIYYQRIEP